MAGDHRRNGTLSGCSGCRTTWAKCEHGSTVLRERFSGSGRKRLTTTNSDMCHCVSMSEVADSEERLYAQ